MALDLILTGKMVTHQGVFEGTSIGVKEGRIVAIGEKSAMPPAAQEDDYGDMLILPGVIDAHVHSLGDINEGHWNSTSAAAAGGITTINDHPLDLGGAPTSPEDIEQKAKRTAKESLVDFTLMAGGIPEKIEDIPAVAKCGITGYKILMQATSGAASYGMRAVDNAELYAMFALIAKDDQIAFVHAEDEKIINYLVDKYIKEGKTYLATHNETRPEVTEVAAVATAIEIAKALGCRLHIVHASVPRTFELIYRARKDGARVTGETCPHFLMCNEDRWKDIGAQFKVNPPLRSERSRIELWELLKQGKIDLIASDHAPHPENHEPNVFDNFSGSPGNETMLALIYSEGVNKGNIGLQDLIKLLSYNPARLLGIYPEKGAIQVGCDADFAVLDPQKKWTIEGKKLRSQSGWSMYEGYEVTGKVLATYVRGNAVYKEGEIVGEKGYGKWIKRKNLCNL
ncbi:MAG: amidohydrolase family protein [Firmicutes bacterium]|nr:amidohydrolase family protein [Bacillota bacterium]